MGIYSEYLDRNFTIEQLTTERKAQLRRISQLRGRDVLVFAADLQKGRLPISINSSDLLPLADQVSNLKGKALDLILETPGGSGETAEDIVKLLRPRFDSVAVIVPGIAKSAGTIMAMAADEILMEPVSALGPIDAQIQWQGKVFSAHALLQGFEQIKDEVVRTNSLNRAYVPILQNLSPGELQAAQNSLDFATSLVTDWLVQYKFREWATHSSTGAPVTAEDRRQRAGQVAKALTDHGAWKTHGRSIKIADLRAMRLQIKDYSETPDLADAIRRYYTLLQMTFSTPVYKLFETPESQIMRMEAAQVVQALQGLVPGIQLPPGAVPAGAEMQVTCKKCQRQMSVFAPFSQGTPMPKPGMVPFPASNKLQCPGCGAEIDLSMARRQLESQTRRPIVSVEEQA